MVEVVLAAIIGPVLVAIVSGLFSWLSAKRAKDAATGAASAAQGAHAAAQSAAVVAESGPTSAEVLTLLHGVERTVLRLEGKVDAVRDDVARLSEWRVIHDAQHALPGLRGS